LTVSGVGIVIGAGIYVLVGEAVKEAGPAVWLSFLVAALLAGLTALTYCELAGMYPSAGVEYDWASRAFNPLAGFLAGWMMAAAYVVAAAAVALGFAEYLRSFVDIDVRISAVALLVVLTVVVALGIQRSIWLSVALAAMQIGGLVFVMIAGAPHIGERSLLEGSSAGGVFSGAALVFFAFIGFDDIATLSEETHDAATTVPRALLLTLLIAGSLYVLVGVSAVSVVDHSLLAGSERPLAEVVERNWGSRGADTLAYIALAATANTTLLVLTAASRLIFAMAREERLPPFLATVRRGGGAPALAALATCVASIPFALTGGLGLVASVTDFAVYTTFVAVNLSVIALRRSEPHTARPFRIPFDLAGVPVFPVLALLVSVLLIAYLRPVAWVLGAGALGAGGLAYAVFVRERVARLKP
jgi:APA family basic amino acid/polyamine antiporter